MIKISEFSLFLYSFGAIVFLGKFQVAQELGVHALGAHVLAAFGNLDTIGMSLLRIVVRARVL